MSIIGPDSGRISSTNTARMPPTLTRSRFVAATIELGVRDDTLISLHIESGVMTLVETVLDNEGRVIIGATMTREVEILPPPEKLKG